MTSRATVTFRNVLVALLAFICAIAMLTVGDARAAVTHPYTGVSFGPGGVGSGSFGNVASVAVDSRSGDVFVLDSEGRGLYKFNASGEPVAFSSTGTNVIEKTESGGGQISEVAVDGSTGPDAGDIYVATYYEGVRIYSESGSYLGELGETNSCGVAVDSSGDVYVSNISGTLGRYAPSANPVTNADKNGSMGGLPNLCNLAVDGAGNVFGANYIGGVYEYEALQFGSLSATGTLVDSSGVTLAVDPQSDELFTDGAGGVTQYGISVQPPSLQGSTGGPGVAGELVPYGSYGVAINHETGKLYVGNGSDVEIFGAPEEEPGAVTEAVYYPPATQATLLGAVEPAGAEVTSCTFEYHHESSYGSVPCEPGPPYAGSSVKVSAVASGLQPGTTYQFRIIAVTSRGTYTGRELSFTTAGPQIVGETPEGVGSKTAILAASIVAGEEPTVHYRVEYGTSASYGNSTASVAVKGEEEKAKVHIGGLSSKTTYHFRFVAENQTATVYGPDVTFTTGNVISNESFSRVSSEAAVVGAEIDPGGVPTSYVVEYGGSGSYGSSTSPVSIGAGEERVDIATQISGLQPGAAYHFRFVVSNESEVNSGGDLSFTTHTLSLSGLPDGRGYEMVTPAENEGAESYVPEDDGWSEEDSIMSSLPFAASTDGNAVAYVGGPTSAGNGSQGDGEGNEYLARRSADGEWVQGDIQPAGYYTPEYLGFSSDLDHSVLVSNEPIGGQGVPSPYTGLYVGGGAGGFGPLFTSTPPNQIATNFKPAYVGASADFTHIFFEANDALTSGAVDPAESGDDLYESMEGHLRLVNILPNGTVGTEASFGAKKQEGPSPVDYSHVISADGSRVFWTNWRNLYVREGGSSTSLVAEEAEYLTASSDGSKVLYTLEEGDLYEDDLQTGRNEDIERHAGLVGILGASEDLEYIYFVGRGVLAAGAQAGGNNLYLLHDGETRYIATLAEQEEEAKSLYLSNPPGTYPWNPDLASRSAEVTPSGHDVVFMSTESLTGYNKNGVKGAFGGDGDEVYVYDAESGALSCASCDPTGEPPNRLGYGHGITGGFFAISGRPTYQLHVISEDGSRVFFESWQPLLPQANNGKLNVYEWERDGSGSCQYATGCMYLLSTGSSPYSSYFVDASASGNDVFLVTRSELVRQDDNEYNDVYDAHVGAVEPPASPRCTGTGCQGVPSSPPIFATPSSVTYNGVGNLAPMPVKAKPTVKSKPKAKVKKKQCTVKKAARGKGKAAAKKRAKERGCQSRKTVDNGKTKKGSAR